MPADELVLTTESLIPKKRKESDTDILPSEKRRKIDAVSSSSSSSSFSEDSVCYFEAEFKKESGFNDAMLIVGKITENITVIFKPEVIILQGSNDSKTVTVKIEISSKLACSHYMHRFALTSSCIAFLVSKEAWKPAADNWVDGNMTVKTHYQEFESPSIIDVASAKFQGSQRFFTIALMDNADCATEARDVYGASQDELNQMPTCFRIYADALLNTIKSISSINKQFIMKCTPIDKCLEISAKDAVRNFGKQEVKFYAPEGALTKITGPEISVSLTCSYVMDALQCKRISSLVDVYVGADMVHIRTAGEHCPVAQYKIMPTLSDFD